MNYRRNNDTTSQGLFATLPTRRIVMTAAWPPSGPLDWPGIVAGLCAHWTCNCADLAERVDVAADRLSDIVLGAEITRRSRDGRMLLAAARRAGR